MGKKSPFYKTGPTLLEGGGIGVTEGNTQSVPATEASNISLGRTTPSTIGKDYSNVGKNLTSAETPKIDTEAGIATGKGSGKINRAKRKQKKDKMKAEGKSRLEVRQAKTKSKIADTKAQLQHLTESSGGKNQGKIARLQGKLKVQTARDKSMTGRKAKREALKNYGK